MNSAIREKAREMRFELEAFFPETVLIEAPEARHAEHRIRVVCTKNPDWYRRFCSLYPSKRCDAIRWKKFKTAIKRADTLRALEGLENGKVIGAYGARLVAFIEDEFKQCASPRMDVVELIELTAGIAA